MSAIQATLLSQKRTRLRRLWRWLKPLPLVVLAAFVVHQRLVAPVMVDHQVVGRGDVVREAFGRATIESRREVELGFDLVGRISDVLVDEGDRVELGQTVAHLAPEQWNAEVDAAASGVSLARAALQRLAAEERRAQATLAYTKQEATRSRQLAAAGTVSAADLDLAEQQLALAQAEVDRMHAAQAEAKKQIAVAHGNAETKVATITRAALISPFDGIVTRRFKDPGDTVTIGSAVLRVVAVDRLWARTAIDESMVSDVRDSMPAEIALIGDRGPALQGTVDRIGREVDRQTHDVLVDVLLAKPPARLAFGQRADVHIALERKRNVTRIPLAFLRRDATGAFVYADRTGQVARAAIEVGAVGRDHAEVVAGLEAGDVILAPLPPDKELPLGRRWSAGP